jgi:transcriptional regulator with XRE-family HTH domain
MSPRTDRRPRSIRAGLPPRAVEPSHGWLKPRTGRDDESLGVEDEDQLIAEVERDPEVAAELARTAVANQLAILVIHYRVEHGLTPTALARQLGMTQAAVARLEAGDHEPTVSTLARLANRLSVTLRLDLSPDSVALVMGQSTPPARWWTTSANDHLERPIQAVPNEIS